MANHVDHLLTQGLEHFRQWQDAEALDCWAQALQADPVNIRARVFVDYVQRAPAPSLPVMPPLGAGHGPFPIPEEATSPRNVSVRSLLGQVETRLQGGDLAGAQDVVDTLLDLARQDGDVQELVGQHAPPLLTVCRRTLGGTHRVPQLRCTREQLMQAALDERTGFVLSRVDGQASFDEIAAMTGLPVLETLGALARLSRRGLIGT